MQYNIKNAEKYWGDRANTVDEYRAVLSYAEHDYINAAYDKWEKNALFSCIGDIKDKKILDIGCGLGRITIPLLELGAVVSAIDNSQVMLDKTEERADHAGLTDKLKIIKSGADSICFEDNYFDVIVCLGLLEHLPDDIKECVVKEIIRLLKRESKAYLIINNKNSVFLKNQTLYTGEQKDNGYYVSLIGLDFIKKCSNIFNFKFRIVSSNFYYSYFKHTVKQIACETNDALKELFAYATTLDGMGLQSRLLDDTFSDQYLIEIKKR